MTPLEKAARALTIAQSGCDDYDALDGAMQETLKENAAAVLRAVREPSEGMTEASKPFRKGVGEGAPRIYTAMIDAALSE